SNGSGLEPLGQSVCPAKILGPSGSRQPIGAVVGQGDGFVVIIKWQDGDYGSEDLLLEQPACARDVGEHGRVDEVSLAVEALPAGDDLDPVVLALVEVAWDARELLLPDQRPDQ